MSTRSLTVLDRLALQTILPQRGSHEELCLIEDLIEMVRLLPEEIRKYDIKNENGKPTWNEEAVPPEGFLYQFSEEHEALIRPCLTHLDKNKMLHRDQNGIYKIFVGSLPESQE